MIERARQMGAGRHRPKVGQLRTRKRLLTRVLVALAVSATALAAPLALESEPAEAAPSTNVVQFVYFVEDGEQYREDHRAAIEKHAFDIQQYWYDQFGGTFTLANPVVAVVEADHDAQYYETTPVGKNAHWFRLHNMRSEVRRKVGTTNTRFVTYPTTRIDGRVGATTTGAWMDYDDLTCITGEARSFPYTGSPAAHCLGHVAHELGHVFGVAGHPGESKWDCMRFGFYKEGVLCDFGEMNREKIRNHSKNVGWLDSQPGDVDNGEGGGSPLTAITTPVAPNPSGVIRVTFINNGCRPVSVYWDRNGTLFKYRTIAAGRQVGQGTFANHKWVFKVGDSVVGSYTAAQNGSYEIPSGGCDDGDGNPSTTTTTPVAPSTTTSVAPSTTTSVAPSTTTSVAPSTTAPVAPSTTTSVAPSTTAPVAPSGSGLTTVKFINDGCRSVGVYWDRNGTLFKYRTIAEGRQVNQRTYVNHKWVFKVGDSVVGRYTATHNGSYEIPSGGCDNGDGSPSTTTPTLVVPATTTSAAPSTTTSVAPSGSGLATVKFINDGCRAVGVYWDRNGTLFKYHTIAEGRQVRQRTYVNHKWVFKVGDSVVGRYTVAQNGSYEIPSGGCTNDQLPR